MTKRGDALRTTDSIEPAVPLRSMRARPLRDVVEALQAEFRRRGIESRDIRGAGALEFDIGTQSDDDQQYDDRPVTLERLEGAIVARDVATAAPGGSRFRAFLDGSQKTLPVWRLGLVPIVYGIAAVGVLDRTPEGVPSLHPSLHQMRDSWIFPAGTDRADLTALERLLDDHHAQVVDSLRLRRGEAFDPRILSLYAHLFERARGAANNERQRLETQTLDDWIDHVAPGRPNDWLVVDGPLRRNAPNTIGLVKELLTQHLDGEEALALFDLGPGQRTTAFRIVSTGTDVDTREGSEARTMWYMRLHDARGQDARYSLVRIEASHDVQTPEEIDEISGWLLAERLPRATADARWPTLLYPIHLLEAMLKRRLASLTVGWQN